MRTIYPQNYLNFASIYIYSHDYQALQQTLWELLGNYKVKVLGITRYRCWELQGKVAWNCIVGLPMIYCEILNSKPDSKLTQKDNRIIWVDMRSSDGSGKWTRNYKLPLIEIQWWSCTHFFFMSRGVQILHHRHRSWGGGQVTLSWCFGEEYMKHFRVLSKSVLFSTWLCYTCLLP